MEITKEDYLNLRKQCISNIMKYSIKKEPNIKTALEQLKLYLKDKQDSDNDIKLLNEYLNYK